MDELGFRYAWTPRYSPAYNGIEECWNIGKQMVKKERLNAIMNGRKLDLDQLIHKSFERIKIESVSKCVNRSL